MSNLANFYHQEVVGKMMEEFGLQNLLACPKIEKVVVNCGLGEAAKNQELTAEIAAQIGQITGQKPVVTFAKRSISGFKIRQGDPVGLKVTLRGGRMFDFLEKLIRVTLPRLRDFRGLPTDNFDKFGNYTLGLKEMNVFPEVVTIPAAKNKGLEITIVTNSKDFEKSKRLLELLRMPFAKN